MVSYYAKRDFPFLRDYDAAVAHEAKIKPMNGASTRYAGCKPLGSRKKPCYQIMRSGDDVVVCSKWSGHNPLVTFRPNGEIVVAHSRYASDCNVQSVVLGTVIVMHDAKMWVNAVAPTGEGGKDGDAKGWFLLRGYITGDTILRRESDGVMRYVNPLYPQKEFVNRKKMNAVRKEFDGFRKFARGFIKLHGEGEEVTVDQALAVFGEVEQYGAGIAGGRHPKSHHWGWNYSGPVPNVPDYSDIYSKQRDFLSKINDDEAAWPKLAMGMMWLKECNMRSRNWQKRRWCVESFEHTLTSLITDERREVLEMRTVYTGKLT